MDSVFLKWGNNNQVIYKLTEKGFWKLNAILDD